MRRLRLRYVNHEPWKNRSSAIFVVDSPFSIASDYGRIMASLSGPRIYTLLTYPRTASNLLVQILALEDQPSLVAGANREYFFGPTLGLRLGEHGTTGRHVDEWTQEESAALRESYQKCYEAFQTEADDAAAKGKNMFVKEHVSWLVEPVAETEFQFGDGTTLQPPWTVQARSQAFSANTHSPLNKTVLPDEVLNSWMPTFLIRHPALVFPSNYRACRDNEGQEAAKVDPGHTVEMTIYWSRSLYDWYLNQSDSSGRDGRIWPIILDATDVITKPSLVKKYARMIGLDPSKLRLAWEPAGKEELAKMSGVERRMRSTLSASTGILKDKAATDLDMDVEVVKWKEEFGIDEAEKIERWVRAAMPDYEYMREKRLRMDADEE